MSSAKRRLLVTGGAGFIGSALVLRLIADGGYSVLNLDKLTYSGRLASLASVVGQADYRFVHGDICDQDLVADLLRSFAPHGIIHLAAESHVDRSIDGAAPFIQTNIAGTFALLEQARRYWTGLADEQRQEFRFHHVSTDEVFGALGDDGFFSEQSPYDPRSPYSASKAASDHLARAWYHTHGLPVLVTNCSNNYGPRQYPEKLIPLVIIKALRGETIPVYGNGRNVRDWLYVDDHAGALQAVFERGGPGQTYVIGGNSERRNIEVVKTICATLDCMAPRNDGASHAERITLVADRPGHDYRYAIDARHIQATLGWRPQVSFEAGIEATVKWYLDNPEWWEPILAGSGELERLSLWAEASAATGVD